MLKVDQIFAERYRVLRPLAQGGMGAVFVAQHTATEAEVALKVLHAQLVGRDDTLEKFELEAKVAARVRSDHIVKVLDAGRDRETGTPFLVMELLRGETLAENVHRSGPLELADARRWMGQLARGLDAAHSHVNVRGESEPIVHRDLKPDNLFLAKNQSGPPQLKILDFGLAKLASQRAEITYDVRGTPYYMAPEQAAPSRRGVSAQTDVWAFGLIAYYLLTGKRYWLADSDPEAGLDALFAEILTLPLAAPTRRVAETGSAAVLPSGFDEWFAGCVVREPGRRYPSAGEAARKLDELESVAGSPRARVGGEPDVGRAGTGSTPSLRGTASEARSSVTERRPASWRWVAAAAGVFLLMSGGAAWLMNEPAPDSVPRAATRAPRAAETPRLPPSALPAVPAADLPRQPQVRPVPSPAEVEPPPSVEMAQDTAPRRSKPAKRVESARTASARASKPGQPKPGPRAARPSASQPSQQQDWHFRPNLAQGSLDTTGAGKTAPATPAPATPAPATPAPASEGWIMAPP